MHQTIKSPLEATKPDHNWKQRLHYVPVSGPGYLALVGYTDHSDYKRISVAIERIEIEGDAMAFFVDWNTESLMTHIEEDLKQASQAA